jgi:hypothetical protein
LQNIEIQLFTKPKLSKIRPKPLCSLENILHKIGDFPFGPPLSVDFSVPCISAHFRLIIRVAAEITAISVDKYFK